jgi:hypothetical protein
MIFHCSFIFIRVKKEGLDKQDISILVKSQQELKSMERRVDLYSDFIRGQQLQKQNLEQEIDRLQSKIKTMKPNINLNKVNQIKR